MVFGRADCSSPPGPAPRSFVAPRYAGPRVRGITPNLYCADHGRAVEPVLEWHPADGILHHLRHAH
ncbi:hypothetical protein ACIOMM_35480 [Streptomyces sp. NPDC087908]|uniref:hypothetical protein n=1 Tax=Streptomyces sp. NPDC087908 TaxID=3365820 RepID=UPI0037F5E283